MAEACPINFTSVDNTVSRLVSLLTAAVVTLFFFTGAAALLYALGADLLVRLYGDRRYSPLFQTAQMLKQLLRLPSYKVDGAAKKVAGHFGLLFILLLILTSHFGLTVAVNAIAGFFLLCLLLDVVFNFCLGCKVYRLYRLVAGAL